MFFGLSAFPLTPMNEQGLDEAAFVCLIERLVAARVDAIGVLGSTGNYAYLTRAERARVVQLAVEHAGDVPVMAGIGALRTREVLELADDAQAAGARGVLLAPVSYQKLTDDEVFGLYETVTRALSVPLCVYDNPGTTRFSFSDALHGEIARLPHVASIKIPGVPAVPKEARLRVERLRARLPGHVSLGVSGDAFGATGLNASRRRSTSCSCRKATPREFLARLDDVFHAARRPDAEAMTGWAAYPWASHDDGGASMPPTVTGGPAPVGNPGRSSSGRGVWRQRSKQRWQR